MKFPRVSAATRSILKPCRVIACVGVRVGVPLELLNLLQHIEYTLSMCP